MDDKKKKFSSGLNVGSSSILVTFVLLCLVTFAALSFVSSNADYKLAEKTADRTTYYYAANNKAEVYLLNADSLLSKHYASCKDIIEYYEGIDPLFADNDSINVDEVGDDIFLNYAVAISESQEIQVSLKFIYPNSEDLDMFEIVKWETVSTYVPSEEPDEEETTSFLF